ncbi:fluoride efflux transporter CrcB [Thalassotalea agariperforans]|jgi:CrcB protein
MTSGISNLTLYSMVALGGAFGASLRFFVYQVMINWLGKGFPYATLTVNVTGSLIMGVLYALIEQGVIEVSVYRSLIGIGFLGAFTTFSTFSLDSLLLLQQGEIFKAISNIFLNVGLCIMSAALGMFMVSMLNK